jgi:hypothetical protein
MEKEYTPSTFSWIMYGLAALALAVSGIYFLSIYNPAVSYFVLLLPLALTGGGILIGVSLSRRKVVIGDSSILCVSLFSTRQLDFAAIKGCRIAQKLIRLEPRAKNAAPISIGNYSDFDDSEELVTWVKSHFTDLDAVNLAAHREELKQDERLGSTEAERQKYLAKTKDIAIAYNIWGGVTAIALLFIKGAVASLLLIAWPALGIILMLKSRGTVKYVSDSNTSGYSQIMLGTALPCIFIMMKSLFEYTLFQYGRLWLPGLGISTVMFVVLYVPGINRSMPQIRAQIIMMAIPALLYGFGSARLINCALDAHKPSVFTAIVLDREIQHGKSVTYYLQLSPWGTGQDERKVEVERDFYRSVADGDTVRVNLKPGLLHVPWYYVSKNDPLPAAGGHKKSDPVQ